MNVPDVLSSNLCKKTRCELQNDEKPRHDMSNSVLLWLHDDTGKHNAEKHDSGKLSQISV